MFMKKDQFGTLQFEKKIFRFVFRIILILYFWINLFKINRFKNEFQLLEKARIEIKKINPPIDGDTQYVSVIVEEQKSQ